jgi:hypothetical protein
MGILSGMLGHATEVDIKEVEEELSPLLINTEKIEKAYRLVRDLFVFTDKRLVLIDKQGITGKKAEYHSIPYRSISHFSTETAGHFDLDSELRVWVKGQSIPIKKEFKKGSNIEGVQKALAHYILK